MKVQIFAGFSHILYEVALALVPLLIFFLLFQFFFLKLPRKKVFNILKGALLAFFGLAFFLQGVNVAFFPVGEIIGKTLASSHNVWLLIPVGSLMGFTATFAEPAVRILNIEVEKVTSGSIPQKIMLYTLSIGVAVSIALSMLRVITGWPLYYFLIPGYLLALLLLRYSSPAFAAIAFDAGGVSTGPMTVTFILAIAVGAASMIEGRNPLIDGFGMISLVALSPILTVLLLGLLYNRQNAGRKDYE